MNEGELITRTEHAQQSGPASLIAVAVQNNLDIEKLEKLLQLQREWDAGQARKAFFEALSKFQSDIPPIVKQDAAQRKKFASLGTINEAIRPWLFENRLSFRFRQHQADNGAVTVTCIVSHADGHSEETSLTAAPDNSGNKNAIQSVGSTVTYLQRYTLVAGLGLTTVDGDDNGESAVVAQEAAARKPTAAEVMESLRARMQVADATAQGSVVESSAPTAAAESARTESAGTEPAGKDTGTAAPDSATVVDAKRECTSAQRSQITGLFEQIGLTLDQRSAVLTKRGVSSLRSLTFDQASELLTNLERKAATLDDAGEQSKQPADAHQAPIAGPCSQNQIDELKKDLLPTLAQSNPDLYGKLVAKLKAFGKIADLSFEQARSLIEQVKAKNLEAFFAASLVKEVPLPTDP